jgi:hypothetical protein
VGVRKGGNHQAALCHGSQAYNTVVPIEEAEELRAKVEELQRKNEE